jgi:hypothetical protein
MKSRTVASGGARCSDIQTLANSEPCADSAAVGEARVQLTLWRLTKGAALSMWLACSATGVPLAEPQVPSRPPPNSEPVAPAQPEPAPRAPTDETRPAFEHCVLHAGRAQANEHEVRGPGGVPQPTTQTGSCTFNAECIREPGQENAGDGFVELSCESNDCSCKLEPRGSATNAAIEFAFTTETACASTDRAKQLLLTHCMVGMKLANAVSP